MIWAFWALNLMAQSFSATFTSRARNSGSLRRHMQASVFSNGIWVLQLCILLGPMTDYIQGKHGHLMQILMIGYYSIFTATGSVLAHYWALKKETGSSAVGANKKYAQITKEEWEETKLVVSDWHEFVEQRLEEELYKCS